MTEETVLSLEAEQTTTGPQTKMFITGILLAIFTFLFLDYILEVSSMDVFYFCKEKKTKR